MPPLMLAGLRFMLVAFSGYLFCRTTESTTEFAAGVWINHQFCAVCFSFFVPLTSVCLLDWLRWCYRHRRFFTIVLGAFTFGERLHGKQLAGIALAIFGVLVLIEDSLNGQHVAMLGFMLTLWRQHLVGRVATSSIKRSCRTQRVRR